jgi:RNA polymerase sigma-70 factor, ECF subfamily
MRDTAEMHSCLGAGTNRTKDLSPWTVKFGKEKRMVASEGRRSQIVRSPNGDHAAFEALIREHQRMIYSLCYRMSGSAADAEDLAQETFIQAYQHLDGFRGEAGLRTWLYRIAVNLCLNWQKREQRRIQVYQEWSEQGAGAPGENASHAQQVQEALLKLPPRQRAAVVLTTYDGLTHAEAAAALGCSETTVSWRVFAARAKLKRLLKDASRPGASQ